MKMTRQPDKGYPKPVDILNKVDPSWNDGFPAPPRQRREMNVRLLKAKSPPTKVGAATAVSPLADLKAQLLAARDAAEAYI